MAPRQVGDTAIFDRGIVEERYEVRVGGVEQAFVFDTRPTCGSCSILSGPVLLALPVAGGRASFAYRLSCDPAYYALEMDARYAVALTSTSPCPILAGLGTTEVIRNPVVD